VGSWSSVVDQSANVLHSAHCSASTRLGRKREYRGSRRPPQSARSECPGPSWSPPGSSLHRSDGDRKSTRLNSSHVSIWYAVFCLKKEKNSAAAARAIAQTPPPR